MTIRERIHLAAHAIICMAVYFTLVALPLMI